MPVAMPPPQYMLPVPMYPYMQHSCQTASAVPAFQEPYQAACRACEYQQQYMMHMQYAAHQHYYAHQCHEQEAKVKQVQMQKPGKLTNLEEHCIAPMNPMRNCSSPRRTYSPRPLHMFQQQIANQLVGSISPNHNKLMSCDKQGSLLIEK